MAYIRDAGGQFAMIDLAGQRFGRLVALKACGRGKDRRVRWLCICDCGREFEVGGGLRNGHTRSCGCLRFIDIAGVRFGRLTAMKLVGKNRLGGLWNCLCDCGAESVVACSTLRSGTTKSCGCLRTSHAKNHSAPGHIAEGLFVCAPHESSEPEAKDHQL
jgi:hypothetical protein